MNFDKYLKIPMFLADDMNIGYSGKLLYSRLLLLTYKEGYCYADNIYLGNLIGVGSRRITKLLKELSDNNYINMEYNHKFQRKIYINKSKYTSINLEEMY